MTAGDQVIDGLVQIVFDRVMAQIRESMQSAGGTSRLLTIKQAASHMGCSTRTIRRLIDTGRLDRVGSDRFIRVERRDLDRLIDDSKERAL